MVHGPVVPVGSSLTFLFQLFVRVAHPCSHPNDKVKGVKRIERTQDPENLAAVTCLFRSVSHGSFSPFHLHSSLFVPVVSR